MSEAREPLVYRDSRNGMTEATPLGPWGSGRRDPVMDLHWEVSLLGASWTSTENPPEMIHYYTELLGMRDTITAQDVHMADGRTEL